MVRWMLQIFLAPQFSIDLTALSCAWKILDSVVHMSPGCAIDGDKFNNKIDCALSYDFAVHKHSLDY